MIKPEQLFQIHGIMTSKALEIIKAKNADYGADEDALRNFRLVEQLGIPMEVGILTRLADKIARIGKIIQSGEVHVKDETIEDTILDAINYLIILRAALNEPQESKNGTN
jgi:hypothetical protein